MPSAMTALAGMGTRTGGAALGVAFVVIVHFIQSALISRKTAMRECPIIFSALY